MKKKIVLFVLFVLPLVAYMFFASGINNFTKLPVVTPAVKEIGPVNDVFDKPVRLSGKITVLGFPGADLYKYRGALYNLQQRIFDRYHDFQDLQFVTISPAGTEKDAMAVHAQIAAMYPAENWHFVTMPASEIKDFYRGLKLKDTLNAHLATPNVFILDKQRNLRGRKGDEYKEGYDTFHPSDLNNKMLDDFKVILYEYKAALKKNHNATKDPFPNEK